MTLLSEIYDVTLKRGNREAAKGGFVRPTVGEHFVTHKDFKIIIPEYEYTEDLTSPAQAGSRTTTSSYMNDFWQGSAAFDDGGWQYCWMSANFDTKPTSVWLKYDFGEADKKTIAKFTLQPHVGSGGGNYLLGMPKDFTFEGSNDDSTWTILGTYSNENWETLQQINSYCINNRTAYRYYKIHITDVVGPTAWNVTIGQIQFMERL